MTEIIDTHSHIYCSDFDADRAEVIARAKDAGVRAVVIANEDLRSLVALQRLADQQPQFAFPAIGLHPESVDGDWVKTLKEIEKEVCKRPYCAIGETGLDFYWSRQYVNEQKEAFEEQLRWSADLHLPVIIHTRKSLAEALESICKTGADRLKGVFHCFGGSLQEWQTLAKLPAFYVGIGGVVTFKNSHLADVLQHIPIERLVAETDAPFLAPVPCRGKRNEPAFITHTISKISEIYGKDFEDTAKILYRNAMNLFNLPLT